jgi:hypothetical protein
MPVSIDTDKEIVGVQPNISMDSVYDPNAKGKNTWIGDAVKGVNKLYDDWSGETQRAYDEAQTGKANQIADRRRQEDMDFQREFAKHGIQWRVEDAKKAGISPLASLGMSPISASQSVVGANPSKVRSQRNRASDAILGLAVSTAGKLGDALLTVAKGQEKKDPERENWLRLTDYYSYRNAVDTFVKTREGKDVNFPAQAERYYKFSTGEVIAVPAPELAEGMEGFLPMIVTAYMTGTQGSFPNWEQKRKNLEELLTKFYHFETSTVQKGVGMALDWLKNQRTN